ncbi:hypothetical protein Tco_0336974 [Tanacetum coccineum]
MLIFISVLRVILMAEAMLLRGEHSKPHHHTHRRFNKTPTSSLTAEKPYNAPINMYSGLSVSQNDRAEKEILGSLAAKEILAFSYWDHPPGTSDRRTLSTSFDKEQLQSSDVSMFMYALTVSTMEPKNVKEAMIDPAWIESMQEELL